MNAKQSVVTMVDFLCQTPEIVAVLLLLAAAIISFVKTKSGLLLVIASGIWALVGCFDGLTLQILLPSYLFPEMGWTRYDEWLGIYRLFKFVFSVMYMIPIGLIAYYFFPVPLRFNQLSSQ